MPTSYCLQEFQIIESMQEPRVERRTHNFAVRQNKSKKWEIEFIYYTRLHKLRTKRGKIREFPKLNGVQKWMEGIRVKEYVVKLETPLDEN